MKNGDSVLSKFINSNTAQLLPGLPLVELLGSNRLLVENHKGVKAYCLTKICIKVSYGELCVCGTNMNLSYMSKNQLVIAGCIDSITLLKKGAGQ